MTTSPTALSHSTPTANDAKLVAVTGPLSGDVLPLLETGATIGRDTSHAICLPDLSLSRSHCAIEMVDGVWRIRDCHSSNGTFVNGLRVEEQPLKNRDRIELGQSAFIFVCGGTLPEPPPIHDRPSDFIERLAIEQTAYLRQDWVAPGTDAERTLRALLQLSTTMNTVESEAELYERIFDALGPVPAEQFAIIVTDRGGEGGVAAVRRLARTQPVGVSRVVYTQAMRERVGLLTRETADNVPPQSILCVPLVAREQALGAVYLTTSRPSPFGRHDLEFTTAVANVAAGALDHTRHIAWLRDERARLQIEVKRDQSLIGRSTAIERVYDVVAKVARSDATVLITGETGTGKELVARLIHAQSARAQRPFVAVNCAALTDTLLESELFGHERGAFTGAHTQKKGKLEAADGGTVFLDEVGELPALLQTKLLRALQHHEFDRVGGTRPIHVDIRIVAATNRDLQAEVTGGRFRRDLYHRLQVVDIHVPPLRERRDDIPVLAAHFVNRLARTSTRPIRGVAPDALEYLMAYDWPGNVRELENAIERAIVLGSSDYVTRDDLPDALLDAPVPAGSERQRFHEAVRATKMRLIEDAFREAGGNYTETAKLLGLNANYLHRLIRNLELKPVLERER